MSNIDKSSQEVRVYLTSAELDMLVKALSSFHCKLLKSRRRNEGFTDERSRFFHRKAVADSLFVSSIMSKLDSYIETLSELSTPDKEA